MALPYIPALVLTAVLHLADVYFLQPYLSAIFRSKSFWFYWFLHLALAFVAAFVLFEKSGFFTVADWPVVMFLTAFLSFSVLRSLSLKFGYKGIGLETLFDDWKGKVVEEVSKVRASDSLKRQRDITNRLLNRFPEAVQLEPFVRDLAKKMQTDPNAILDRFPTDAEERRQQLAEFIASTNPDYADHVAGREVGTE